MFEVVQKVEREKGIFYQTFAEALDAAREDDGNLEMWQVADDEVQTRLLLIYPR